MLVMTAATRDPKLAACRLEVHHYISGSIAHRIDYERGETQPGIRKYCVRRRHI